MLIESGGNHEFPQDRMHSAQNIITRFLIDHLQTTEDKRYNTHDLESLKMVVVFQFDRKKWISAKELNKHDIGCKSVINNFILRSRTNLS